MAVKLKLIAFAGIDDRTSPDDLWDVYSEHPGIEFGVLCTPHWYENGNRYLNPLNLRKFEGLPLCAHLCGRFAADALRDRWGAFKKEYFPDGDIPFGRLQLNVSSGKYVQLGISDFKRLRLEFYFDGEVALQQKSPSCQPLYGAVRAGSWVQVSPFYDASGGFGKDVRFEGGSVRAIRYGMSGGIGRDNVLRKLREARSASRIGVGEFWIDMESKVRTDGWFDVKKVRQVLKIVENSEFGNYYAEKD